MTIESFLEGHVRAFEWLGGVPRECVYDNLRSAVARRERVDGARSSLEPAVLAAARPLRLSRARLHARDAAREGLGRGRGPLPEDRVLAGAAVRATWPSSTSVYAGWRDRVALPRRHATGRHIVAERLAHEREQLRPLPPIAFDAAGRRSSGSRPTATSSSAAASTARRRRWSISASSCAGIATTSGSSTTATTSRAIERSYEHGIWQPAPQDAPRAAAGRAAGPDHGPAGRPAGADRLRRALRMSPKQDRGGRRAAALPAAQAQDAARPGAARADRRDRPRGGLALRAVPRGAARGRGVRPRRVRGAQPHPPRRVPGPQDAGGLRLHRPARRREAADPAPRPARLGLRAHERLLLRAARHRQDAPRDRAGDQGLPGRPPRRVRDRPAMDRPPRASPAPQRPRRRTAAPRALQPARRRRDRLPARWNARPRTCSSRWSRAATNAARSSSPATAASRPGARSSATRWSPPRSSTASFTTPTSSPSKARATGCARGAPPPRRRP